jgi:hypothetical protein
LIGAESTLSATRRSAPRIAEGNKDEGLARADIKNRAGGALANRAEAPEGGLFEI